MTCQEKFSWGQNSVLICSALTNRSATAEKVMLIRVYLIKFLNSLWFMSYITIFSNFQSLNSWSMANFVCLFMLWRMANCPPMLYAVVPALLPRLPKLSLVVWKLWNHRSVEGGGKAEGGVRSASPPLCDNIDPHWLSYGFSWFDLNAFRMKFEQRNMRMGFCAFLIQ